jgi:hypothetical protein
METEKLLFAEEGAVYHLHGEEKGGYIVKMKPFNTEQAIHVPDDFYYFEKLPQEINERIYYYCFIDAIKDRNFEAAYFFATHVSSYLARKIYLEWFENPALDIDFDLPFDIRIVYAEIRAYITFASLIFDVYSEKETGYNVYPLKLEFNSRFKKRTRPYALSRIPDPCSFIDNQISFNLIEIEEPLEYAAPNGNLPNSSTTIQLVTQTEPMDLSEDEQDFMFNMEEAPIFQNVHYLEFRKGSSYGDYCLVDGTSFAAGIIEVKQIIHPCVFIELFDCSDDTWVNVDNYPKIQYSMVWKKFQDFLRFTLDPNLGLFFRVAPTNTFVALQ